MKWPSSLTFVRHDVSKYNALKAVKQADPHYQAFLAEYRADPFSKKTRALALSLHRKHVVGTGDHDTPLAEPESRLAFATGRYLSNTIALPDAVFVSPYERTLGTLRGIANGWPKLTDVPVVEERRIREQEHGLVLLYNDWKIFTALHPDQLRLRELEGNFWYRFPQGENVPDVETRVRSWFDTLVREYAGKHVLVVTHHLTILAVRALLERWTAEKFIDIDKHDPPKNLSVTSYRGEPNKGKDGKLVLTLYNERAPL